MRLSDWVAILGLAQMGWWFSFQTAAAFALLSNVSVTIVLIAIYIQSKGE